MAKLDLLVVGTTIAALQTVGLIGVEVGNRRHFEPALLSLGINLEVVADGTGETLVTATKTQDAVRQFELLEQPLDMFEHLAMRLGRMFGSVDTYDLNLRELVQTVQATHILAIGTSFATEALGVGAVLDGEVLLVDDDITIDVGDGHFGGWDEIEIVNLAVVHLSLLVGQLACAVARILVDNCRRHDLLIAGIGSFGEEEVDEGTLQTSAETTIDGESCTSNLDTEVEVDKVKVLGEFPVWQLGSRHLRVAVPIAYGILTEYALLKVGLDNPIVLGTSAFGHLVVGDIRNLAEHVVHLGLACGFLIVEILVDGLEFGNASLGSLGLVALAILHEHAYAFGETVCLGEVVIEGLLRLTALLVLGDDGVDGFACAFEMLFVQTGNDAIVLLGDEFQC